MWLFLCEYRSLKGKSIRVNSGRTMAGKQESNHAAMSDLGQVNEDLSMLHYCTKEWTEAIATLSTCLHCVGFRAARTLLSSPSLGSH